ncbi:MFS transporter [Nocardioides sp. T2.26MG-1]|uniref:MFS transporter n=1 Tax=Nocardioides sp. T2.26MG-1 TaxID=3041166 RepID=UPI00247793B8|nr:MFS transporter [Nocardioides sp. T2.26MG-1]CAI9405029.1 Drug efflux pump JefA [Nocardioides sp. T2.26MG-1]
MTTPTTVPVASTAGAASPATPEEPLLRMHPLGLAAALAAVMIPIMSFFTVNVALGSIGSDLGATPAVLQLVVAAYGVVYASLVAMGGRLGDGFGRKRMLVLGLLVFAVTSLLCAFAQSPSALVGARFIQGASAALVAPQVLATLHAANEGHHRNRALAWFGASAGLGTSLAFLIGGTLTDSDLGWRAIFWVNVPIAALVMLGVWRFVPETKAPTRPALDLVGAALLGTALTLLVLPLTEGRATGWPAWTWACLAGVLPVTAVLAWWQLRVEARGGTPLVPPSLFRFRSIGVGLLTGLPFFVAFGGFMFVYGYAAQVAGRTPLDIGVSLLPMSLGFLVASLVAGRLVPRYGAWVLTLGALVGAVGFAWLGAVGIEDTAPPLPAVAVVGLGFGLTWSPLMGVVLSQVHGHMAGLGSGLLITTMQAGLGLGAAVVGSIYLAQTDGFAPTTYLLGGVMLVIAALTRLLEPRR